MNEFDQLMGVADRLNAPDGCPWDIKQTFESLKPYVLEEAYELLDAVDKGDDEEILEELGDLFYTVIFYFKVAEREGKFKLEDMLKRQREKLIRRHPHVFGERKAENADEITKIWEEVKAQENKVRKSALDRIPKGLDTLMRAEKVIGKIDQHDLISLLPVSELGEATEEGIAQALIGAIYLAVRHKIDVVGALRRTLSGLESAFRAWEEKEVTK